MEPQAVQVLAVVLFVGCWLASLAYAQQARRRRHPGRAAQRRRPAQRTRAVHRPLPVSRPGMSEGIEGTLSAEDD